MDKCFDIVNQEKGKYLKEGNDIFRDKIHLFKGVFSFIINTAEFYN